MVPTISDEQEINDCLSTYLQKDDKLALLLDYDGTLAPLASHPSLTIIEPESEKAIYTLIKHPNLTLAVISGRGVDDVKTKMNFENIIFAGNHGLEIVFTNNSRYNHQVPQDVKDNFEKICHELTTKLCKNGAWLENKTHSLTFHYRNVPVEEHEALNQQVKEIVEAHGFLANRGHCSTEAKPPVQWNKGEAALYILRELFGNNWENKVKVIFAGDDTTDEDAMKALKGKAVTFRVSNQPEIITNADYRVPSTDVVAKILTWIVKRLT